MADVEVGHRVTRVRIDHATSDGETSAGLAHANVHIFGFGSFLEFKDSRFRFFLNAGIERFQVLTGTHPHNAGSAARGRGLAYTDFITSRPKAVDTINTAIVRLISGATHHRHLWTRIRGAVFSNYADTFAD